MLYAVCNPTSGNGRGKKVAIKISKALDERGIPCKILYTAAARQAEALAKRALDEGADKVLAIGGDGTAYEVSLALADTGIPMGIIPAGTGNDFIKSTGIPKDPLKALDCALTCTARKTDMGYLNDRMFLNVIGTGFDVNTLDYANKAKRYVRGLLPYLYGVIRTIFTFQPIQVTVQIDGEKERTLSTLICAVANGRFIGGGIPIAPDASPDDGMFDVILIRAIPRKKMPFYLPKLLAGKVMSFPETERYRAKKVVFKAPDMRMNIDGEVVSVPKAETEVAVGKLLLLRP